MNMVIYSYIQLFTDRGLTGIKLKLKERNLLLYSESTKEFPWLHELLQKNKKLAPQNIPIKYQNEYKNIIRPLLKQAGEEWKGNDELLNPVEDLGDKRIKCSLCNTPNRMIHYIKNKINGTKLNVGGDCIKQFVEFEGLQFGKSRSQLISEAKKIRRIAEINDKCNDIGNILEAWDRKIDNYEVMIPNFIREPYLALGEKIKEKYNGYLDLKYKENVIDEIVQLFNQYSRHYIKMIENYENEHKSKTFVVTRAIVRWLERENEYQLISELRKTGYLDENTIGKIYETNFIRSMQANIVDLLESLPLLVERFDYEDSQIIINLDMYNGSIWLACPFSKFMRVFGCLLISNGSLVKLTLSNLVKVSTFFGNSSVEFLVDFIASEFRKNNSEIYFSLHEESFSRNEVDIINIKKNEVLTYSLSKFVEMYKVCVIERMNPDEISRDEIHWIKEEGKRYTIQELSEIRGIGSNISDKYYNYSNDKKRVEKP